ncbi:phage major capsid protein [Haematobacter massiliensis]|uniref:phage major capsid protein n=1 Tax=Haematobacter massiliensis TaxID=195105 RepID=UPI0023EF7629|nr:phage major capsid protein [Haematobacter massiliensis]
MKLDDLRRARAAAAQAMQAKADALGALEDTNAAADSAEMVAALAAFDAAKAEFATADKKVKRAEEVEAAQAAAAVGDDGQGAASPVPRPAEATNPAHKGVEIGFMVQALAAAKGDRERAALILDKHGNSGISAALSGATETAGGVTVPRPLASGLIEMLRARVVVRASGARSVPMPAGQLRHARQTAPATASYTAENAAIPVSQPAFGNLDMAFKKLTGLVPVGNSLINHSSTAMAGFVRDDLLNVMGLREDLSFLRGDGTANAPKGARNWMLAANWTAGVAASEVAAEAAIRRCVARVEDANVSMVAPGWIMRASAKAWLASLRTQYGTLLFPTIDASGTLMGFPIRTTSQIPDNLGTGGNETEIYFGDWAAAMIGDAAALSIGISSEAAYYDGTQMVSAFQNDMTLIRAISEHDYAPEQDAAFAGFNAAGWSL